VLLIALPPDPRRLTMPRVDQSDCRPGRQVKLFIGLFTDPSQLHSLITASEYIYLSADQSPLRTVCAASEVTYRTHRLRDYGDLAAMEWSMFRDKELVLALMVV
jgi:hypothetical protein